MIGIKESYLEALNNGAVPTIPSSWQSVEEAECNRAFDSPTEVYESFFDSSKPPEKDCQEVNRSSSQIKKKFNCVKCSSIEDRMQLLNNQLVRSLGLNI